MDKVYKVAPTDLSEYVDSWINNRQLPNNYDLQYCHNNGFFIAVDNSEGACFVEEFSKEENAVLWLLNNELSVADTYQKEISKDILDNVIDKTNKQKEELVL